MLKGHVFSKQIFENPIFALFIDTFLNGYCGVSDKYRNKMEVTTSGNRLTVQSGALCVRGRFIEEDTSSTIQAGTDTAFCKLVIEMDLDKENTSTELKQVTYKIVKGISSYPSLTQMESVIKNNSGIYQYELARFKTSINGITDFKDMRTYLDFDSIYTALINKFDTLKTEIQNNANGVLQQIQSQLDSIVDRSGLVLSSNITTIEGSAILEANSDEGMQENRYKQTIIELDYPNSFNKDNCKMISFGGKFDLNKGYAYGIVPDNSSVGAVTGAIPRSIILQDKIRVQLYNWANIEKTYYYEITLMKK